LVLEEEVGGVEALAHDLSAHFLLFLLVVALGAGEAEMFGYFFHPLGEEVDPGHEVDVLLGDLGLCCGSGVVVESAPHEVSPLAVVLAAPAILDGAIDGLVFHQIVVALRLHEIPVPFLEFPIVLLEEGVEVCLDLERELSVHGEVDQLEDGHDECRRVHLEDVLVDEF